MDTQDKQIPSIVSLEDMPETKKKLQVKEQSETIGNFLMWLEKEGYSIGSPTAGIMDMPYLLPENKSINQWLAEYFKIDLDKLEHERLALLEKLANQIE